MKFLLPAFAVVLFALSGYSQQVQPVFAAADIDGNPIDLAALRGKIVVVNLWFVGCPNCMDEIGPLNQLVDEYKNKNDVVFLGLAASPKPVLEKFLTKNPFKYTIVPNAQMIILTKFGTPDQNGDINVPFPMHYVIDRTGKIITKTQGIKGVDTVRTELKRQIG